MNKIRQVPLSSVALAALATLILCSMAYQSALAATPAQDAVAYLQSQFGLNERQAQGALGALLVYAREQVPKPEFDQLAARMPRAEQAMQAVKQQGVVTRPLNDIDDYKKALGNLGIAEPIAEQIAPAVVQFLGQAGFNQEQAILEDIILR